MFYVLKYSNVSTLNTSIFVEFEMELFTNGLKYLGNNCRCIKYQLTLDSGSNVDPSANGSSIYGSDLAI